MGDKIKRTRIHEDSKQTKSMRDLREAARVAGFTVSVKPVPSARQCQVVVRSEASGKTKDIFYGVRDPLGLENAIHEIQSWRTDATDRRAAGIGNRVGRGFHA